MSMWNTRRALDQSVKRIQVVIDFLFEWLLDGLINRGGNAVHHSFLGSGLNRVLLDTGMTHLLFTVFQVFPPFLGTKNGIYRN